jgi:predicted lipoprotein with Yx(FWY)xxD motif
MKRILFVVAAAALASASLAGGSIAPTVKTTSVGTLGKVVVSASGRTLYHYTDETRGKVDCTGSCAKLWPPLLVKAGAKPVAGPGIAKAKLGIVKRPDGTSQVTYGGLGLYLYAGDKKSGDANGEELENSWFAVSPAAKIVKAKAAASSSNSSGGAYDSNGYTSTTSGSTGPGYDSGY